MFASGNLGAESSVGKLRKALSRIDGDAESASDAMKDATDSTEDFGDAMDDASDRSIGFADVLKANLLGNVIVSGIKALGGSVKNMAGQFIDSAATVKAQSSQFEQTFEEFQSEATEAIRRVASEGGILETRLNTLGSRIYAFARSSGGDASESLGLMERALRVAADSAAYYDTSVEQATETLQSFLKGNFENDAALGLSATETTRNAAAMDLFGKEFKELSEIQKQETLLKMVEDSQKLSGAMGQASREADGWENVLGNLKESWRQLKAAFGEPILDSVTPMLQNATVAVQNFTAKVDWERVSNTITQSFDTAVNAVTALADTIETLAPIIAVVAGAFASLKAGMAIQHLVQGFQNAQVSISLLTMGLKDTTLAQAALNGTMTVGETIVALLTGKMTLAQLAQAAMTKGQLALNTALSANPIGAVIAVVGALIAAVVVLWNTNDDFRNAIISAWGKIKETISGAVSAIKTFFTVTIPDAAKTAVKWFQSIPNEMRNIGVNLVMGLWDGIKSMGSWIAEKIGDFLGGIVDGAKDLLGIHSPSRVFADIGKNMALGLGDGWEDSFGRVRDGITRGLDFGAASVDFASSGLGVSSAGIINSMAAGADAGLSDGLTVNLTLPDGTKFATWQLPYLIKAGSAAGTPIADPQWA